MGSLWFDRRNWLNLGVIAFCGFMFDPVLGYADDEELLIISEDDDEETGVLELDAIEVQDNVERGAGNGGRPSFAQTVDTPRSMSINEWLETVNGIYGDSSGKGTRSIIVRGFETRQIDFTFNGMPLDTGFDGMTVLDVMPMNWISAGRVAHADASSVDGAGLGGRIDLYAFKPSLLETSVEISPTGVTGAISHGMYKDEWRWAVTAGGIFSLGFNLSHQFEASPDEDGGLRDASGKRGGNFLIKVGRSLGKWGDIELMTGWTQAPRDVPTGIDTGAHRFWKYTSWREAFALAKLTWNTDFLSGWLSIWANDQGNTLQAYDDVSRTTQHTEAASTTIWQDDDYGFQIEMYSMPWQLGNAGYLQTLLRSDIRYQRHESDEETYRPHKTVNTDCGRLIYNIRPAIEWQITPDIRVFASGNAMGAKALFQDAGDARENVIKLEDVHNGGMSAGLDYRILDNLDLNLRVARRLRLPTLKEQFRNLPGNDFVDIGGLKPEHAWDFEAEIHWKPIEEVAITMGGFDTEIRDLIEYKYINETKIAFNVAQSRIAGTDIALKLGAWRGVSFDVSYHYLYAYDLSQEHELDGRPAHHFRASVSYQPIEKLTMTLGTQFESKRRTQAWMTKKTAWLDNIFLLNAEIEYQIDHFSIYLRGTNLTDYNYSRTIGYPEAGINVMLGAKIVY